MRYIVLYQATGNNKLFCRLVTWERQVDAEAERDEFIAGGHKAWVHIITDPRKG